MPIGSCPSGPSARWAQERVPHAPFLDRVRGDAQDGIVADFAARCGINPDDDVQAPRFWRGRNAHTILLSGLRIDPRDREWSGRRGDDAQAECHDEPAGPPRLPCHSALPLPTGSAGRCGLGRKKPVQAVMRPIRRRPGVKFRLSIRSCCMACPSPNARRENAAKDLLIRNPQMDERHARATFTTASVERPRSRWMLVLLGGRHGSLNQIKCLAVSRRCGHAHRNRACDGGEAENATRAAESARSAGKRERALKWDVAILILQAKIYRSCVRSLQGISVASGHLESSCVRPGRETDRKC
jgi:hypothetical protein